MAPRAGFARPQPLDGTALRWSNRNEVRERTCGGSPGLEVVDLTQIRRHPWAKSQGKVLGRIEYGAPMQSMQKPKPTDDPHDILVVAPEAVRVAPDPVGVVPDP